MNMTLRIQRIREVVIAELVLLLLLFSTDCGIIRQLPFAATAFTISPPVVIISSYTWNHHYHSNQRRIMHESPFTVLYAAAAKKNKSENNIPFRNEFSRTVQPDRIIRITRGRDFRMSLQANATECQDLAKRFGGPGSSLTSISKLEASITLRPESLGNSGSAGVVDLFGGIEAQGTCMATITQTCVRTNEKFQVDLEFPLYSIVRPTVAATAAQQYSNYNDDVDENEVIKSNDNNKKRKKSSSYRGGKNLNEMNTLQLQRMMQEDISMENDALMQDESIYPSGGLFDVGELITQLFFLNIDPYPKKPGTSTNTVNQKWSISG